MTEDQTKTIKQYQRYINAGNDAKWQYDSYESMIAAYPKSPAVIQNEMCRKRDRRYRQYNAFIKKAGELRAKITEPPSPFVLSDFEDIYAMHVYYIEKGGWEMIQRFTTLDQAQVMKQRFMVDFNMPSNFVVIELIQRTSKIVLGDAQ